MIFNLVFQACLEQWTSSSLSRERKEYFADDPHHGLNVVSWFEGQIVIMINNNNQVWWHCRCVAPYKTMTVSLCRTLQNGGTVAVSHLTKRWHCRCVAPYKTVTLSLCRTLQNGDTVAVSHLTKRWHCLCRTLQNGDTVAVLHLTKRWHCRCVVPYKTEYKLCRLSQLSSHPFLAFVVIDVWMRVFSVQEMMGNWSCGWTFECVEQGCARWEGCRDN